MWSFTWILKVVYSDRMISLVKWTRFEGKSLCLYQDTNKHFAQGPEKKHGGICQRNRYWSYGQRWEPYYTDHSTARFSLANIRTHLTLITWESGSVWPTSGPIWHWPLHSQIQSGHIRTHLTLTTSKPDSVWPHPDPSDTDHLTARFSLANIRTHLTVTTSQPDSVWPHSDPSTTDHLTATFSLAYIRTHLALNTWRPDSVWPTSGPIWHRPLDSQVHVKASVPTASYFWVCPLEQDWPTEPAYGMLPSLTVWSESSKQRAPPLSSVVVWAGNQNNIVLTYV
jgi:hypothetical protein